MNGQFNVIPDAFIDYLQESGHYFRLLKLMPSINLNRSDTGTLYYSKVNTSTLWYILATLKKTLGKEEFTKCVGIRFWDMGLTMVDSRALSESEAKTAFSELKRLLLSQGIDPSIDHEGSSFYTSKARYCFIDLAQLCEEYKGDLSIKRIPAWNNVE